MTPPDWERIRPVLDVLQHKNREFDAEDGASAVAHRDQVDSAMRDYLTGLGVDLDNPVAVHALIAGCITMQYAARHNHRVARSLGHEQMVGAVTIASAVAHVVVDFVPAEVLR